MPVKKIEDQKEVYDEKYFEAKYSSTKKEQHPIWNELKDIRNKLNGVPFEDIRTYIKTHMKDEVSSLQDMFNKDFGALPRSDPLRMEILQTLGELGIKIY